MATISEQLKPLIRAWAEEVQREAADSVFQATQALCPVGTGGDSGEGGALRASGQLEPDGPLAWRITYDDIGFTDEGPVAHEIRGDPFLAFDWPEAGLYPAVFRSVQWVPGAGVAANKGWFSERSATQEQFEAALLVAAEAFSLDDVAAA